MPLHVAKYDRAPDANVREVSPAGVVRRLRLWKRTQVQIAVTIASDHGRWGGRICDITAHGAGLVCTPGLQKDDAVTLTLEGGRSIAATVRWRLGMRAGVAFARALAADDSLLRGIVTFAPPMAPAPIDTLSSLDARMMRRACREQGFAWLAEAE